MDDRTTFGQHLKRLRKGEDLTQYALAEAAGCSIDTIKKIERGALRPSRQLAELLAEALNVESAEREEFVRWARGRREGPSRREEGGVGNEDGGGESRDLELGARKGEEGSFLTPSSYFLIGRSSLPVPPTSLVGREEEIASAVGLLSRVDMRLLTLTGPPGIGKTRLALEVAAEVQGRFREGAVFVNLASIVDARLVGPVMARALGVSEGGELPVEESLRAFLRDRELLLVVDNFEQVAAAAPLVAELLAGAPGLKVLATSRSRLHVRGEHEMQVPGLGMPEGVWAPVREELLEFAAARLFVERASAIAPEFEVTDENAGEIAEICLRLDGLPLAIELAAARIKILPPRAILGRLEKRLALLTGGEEDLPPRQRTLREAIEWSYDLLEEGERRLFRRMSVFEGGRSLEGIEAVCEGEKRIEDGSLRTEEHGPRILDSGVGTADFGMGIIDSGPRLPDSRGKESPGTKYVSGATIDGRRKRDVTGFLLSDSSLLLGPLGIDVLDGVGSLVDKSLLQREAGYGGEPRFVFLQTIHEYAREKLAESGEEAEVEARHARFFLTMAEEKEGLLRGKEQQEWMERLEAEMDNFRRALRWCLREEVGDEERRGRLEMGLRLASALWLFWTRHGHMREGRGWLEEAVERAGEVEELRGRAARAKALYGAGVIAFSQADRQAAERLLEESIAIWRSLGDRKGAAEGMAYLGLVKGYLGRQVEEGKPLLEESVSLLREEGEKWALATALGCMGYLPMVEREYGKALPVFEEAMAIFEELGDRWSVGWVKTITGEATRCLGEYEKAARLYEESLALHRELGDRHRMAVLSNNLGYVKLHQGDLEGAEEYLREGMVLLHESGSESRMLSGLPGLAAVARGQGAWVRAARLLGAAEAQMEAWGFNFEPTELLEFEQNAAAVKGEMEVGAFAAAWEEGRGLRWDEVVSYAMGREA